MRGLLLRVVLPSGECLWRGSVGVHCLHADICSTRTFHLPNANHPPHPITNLQCVITQMTAQVWKNPQATPGCDCSQMPASIV